jgi:putative PEP-CTERM system TPR-repeat lipoprotein
MKSMAAVASRTALRGLFAKGLPPENGVGGPRPRLAAAAYAMLAGLLLVGSHAAAEPIGVAPNIPPLAGEDKGEVEQALNDIRRKEFGKALERAARIIATKPGDPIGYNIQGGAYLGQNDLARARRSFEKALNLRADDKQALLNLAQLDLGRKDFASARRRYQAILDADPKNVQAMLSLAQLEANDRNAAEELVWLERAKTTSPQVAAPRLLLGAYYVRLRQFGKALAELTEAQRQHPDDPEVLDAVGKVQLASGHTADAVATYRRLVEADRESAVAYLRLATAQIGSEDPGGATASLNQALRLKPGYPPAVFVLAELELQAGRNAEALTLARKLQALQPKSSNGLMVEGDVLARQGQLHEAMNAYSKALAVRPSGLLVVKLHAAQVKAGDRARADSKIQQWLASHPSDVIVRQYIADEHLIAGRDQLAIDQYESLLKYAPDTVSALNNLASLYQKQHDSRALSTAEKAHELAPDSPKTLDTLGWILIQRGELARGLGLLSAASAKTPKSTAIRYHVAVALAKSGDRVRARQQLESLLADSEKFSDREAAERLLKEL